MAFKLAFDYGDGNGTVTTTPISDTKVITGNNTGKTGNLSSTLSSGNLIVTLNQSSGNYFDFTSDYSGVTGDVRFDFGNTPVKNFEFYLFWHNYKDEYNHATNTFNNYQTVNFKDGVGTLNNSNTSLVDNFTQVFKFTTINTGSSYYGTMYMRNCR